MEKIILTKKNILISISFVLFLSLFLFYKLSIKQNEKEKYFDVILASLYNENEIKDLDSKLLLLSNLDDPEISFFSDLRLASIDNLEKYEKLDKDLIILKKALLNPDRETLKVLSLDENFLFKDIARIYFFNLDLDNFDEIYNENAEDIDNFFFNAVKRYQYENN
tara:strand:+ start:189 stop:683 length:495 start_codon:yes stop_codon:yes gene_type:complete